MLNELAAVLPDHYSSPLFIAPGLEWAPGQRR
jgi:hypothetical protein